MIKNVAVAPTADNGAISCLFRNLDILIGNQKIILSNQEYSNIKISGLFVGGLYVGMHEMFLGDILSLWKNTAWHTDNKYYYSIIGTPLSGMNTAKYFDLKTRQHKAEVYFDGNLHFLGLAKPALEHMKKYTQVRAQSKLTIFDLVKQLQR